MQIMTTDTSSNINKNIINDKTHQENQITKIKTHNIPKKEKDESKKNNRKSNLSLDIKNINKLNDKEMIKPILLQDLEGYFTKPNILIVKFSPCGE